MTTEDAVETVPSGETLARMTQNLKKVEELSERLQRVMTSRQTHDAALDAPSHDMFGKAAQAYWSEAINNPAKVLEHQMSYWSDTLKHFAETVQLTQSKLGRQAGLQGVAVLALDALLKSPLA